MEKLYFYYDNSLTFSDPVSEHDFLLRCVPAESPEQRVAEFSLDIRPITRGGRYGTDAFGNRTFTGRISAPHNFFHYTVRGCAIRDDSRRRRTEPNACYRYPSKLTEPTDALCDFLKRIAPHGNFLDRAVMIADAVHEYFTYTPGVTGVETTAGEAFSLGQGVCQDYTHVLLALARLDGIPARYVSGLPRGEGASHAWAEVWYDGFWHGVDATRHCMADEGYLKLCTGRDFRDCPVEVGVFAGNVKQKQQVYMKVMDQQ